MVMKKEKKIKLTEGTYENVQEQIKGFVEDFQKYGFENIRVLVEDGRIVLAGERETTLEEEINKLEPFYQESYTGRFNNETYMRNIDNRYDPRHFLRTQPEYVRKDEVLKLVREFDKLN